MKNLVITIILLFLIFSNNPSQAQWVHGNGLLSGNVTSVCANGNYIYTSILGSGLFLSSDNGTTWVFDFPNLPEFTILTFLVNGNNLFAGAYTGLYISANNGMTWIKTGLPTLQVFSIMFNDDNLFVGTNNGVYLSTNNGTTWAAKNNGMTSQTVYSLLYLDSNIYAGTWNGVYRSTNNGTNWTQINTGLTNLTVDLASFAAIDSNIYVATYGGGVFSITNNDTIWTPVNLGLTNLFAFSIVAKGSDLFVSTTKGGVYHSTDKGINWMLSNNGLSKYNVLCLAVNNTNIYAAFDYDGVYQSADNGLTWKQIGLPISLVGNFMVNGNDLFCGYSGGIALSSDDGLNWKPISHGLDLRGIGYNAITLCGSNIIIAGDSGIFRSTNNGASWTKINNGLNVYFKEDDYITAMTSNGPDIFAGTQRNGMFLSTNSGVDWVHLEKTFYNYMIRDIAVSGTNVLVGTDYGIYRSSDKGISWNEPVLQNKLILSLAVSGNNVVAGGMNIYEGDSLNVFLSTDNGTNWAYKSNDPYVHMMNKVSISGSNVFVCADNYASFSTNYGAGWTKINADTFQTTIYSLQVKDSYILAGTYGAGVWRRPFSELTGISKEVNELPKVFTLAQNYPNPFNPNTVISYSLPLSSNVKLIVYNALGQMIKTLESGYKQAGNYSITFNASNLPSGIYFYKLEAGQFSQLKKMMLIK